DELAALEGRLDPGDPGRAIGAQGGDGLVLPGVEELPHPPCEPRLRLLDVTPRCHWHHGRTRGTRARRQRGHRSARSRYGCGGRARSGHAGYRPAIGWAGLRGRGADGGMPSPGELFAGRFRLHGLVGSGGMGEVWRATDEALGRIVAVKVLRPELLAEPGFADRFRIEARTLATIRHPGVVTVHDYQHGDAGTFLVMEYI